MTARQLPLPWPEATSNAREDIVVGDANRLAVAALDSWPHWPHPVLFVHGPAGSGKTHLAHAWLDAAAATPFDPGRFDPAEKGFRILLEDIDRAGHSERDVFALLNAARLGGGTALVTARRPPAELAVALPDLRSRLRAATATALGAPDDALLATVLAKLFADRQIEIDPRLLGPAVLRMERSFEAARRLVERVDRETMSTGRAPTRRLMFSLLGEEHFEDR